MSKGKKALIRACRSCDYFEDYTKNHNDVVGHCRRYPPKPITGDVTRPDDLRFARESKSHNFPWVHKECWCGEYVKRGANTKGEARK